MAKVLVVFLLQTLLFLHDCHGSPRLSELTSSSWITALDQTEVPELGVALELRRMVSSRGGASGLAGPCQGSFAYFPAYCRPRKEVNLVIGSYG